MTTATKEVIAVSFAILAYFLVMSLIQNHDQQVKAEAYKATIQHLTLANANTTKPCILRKGNETHEWPCVEKDKFIEVML